VAVLIGCELFFAQLDADNRVQLVLNVGLVKYNVAVNHTEVDLVQLLNAYGLIL
jgi:hypothetical protein